MALHGRWIRAGTDQCRGHSGINLYHLRVVSPARRRLRRALCAATDSDRRFQSIGYDYPVDERGMILEPIPERRGFHPPFVEDQGLPSADPVALAASRRHYTARHPRTGDRNVMHYGLSYARPFWRCAASFRRAGPQRKTRC
jgi:hypothetical protein